MRRQSWPCVGALREALIRDVVVCDSVEEVRWQFSPYVVRPVRRPICFHDPTPSKVWATLSQYLLFDPLFAKLLADVEMGAGHAETALDVINAPVTILRRHKKGTPSNLRAPGAIVVVSVCASAAFAQQRGLISNNG